MASWLVFDDGAQLGHLSTDPTSLCRVFFDTQPSRSLRTTSHLAKVFWSHLLFYTNSIFEINKATLRYFRNRLAK